MTRVLMRLSASALSAVVLLVSVNSARATNYTWNNAAGGSFQTLTNWTPNTPAGGPTSTDTAIFGTPTSAYSVTLTSSVTILGLQVSQGSPTLALTAGQTFTVFGNNAFSVGTTAGQTANLKITGGTLALTSNNSSQTGTGAGIGSIAGATGNLIVDGAGTSFTTNSFGIDIGNIGTGSLTVQNGASATIGGGINGIYVGPSFGSNGNGSINVTGSGSTLTLNTVAFVGINGVGAITISNGASASIAGVTVGGNTGATGTVTVGGAGVGTLTLTGASGIGTGGGAGNLIVNAGSTLNANAGMVIISGAVTVNGAYNQNVGTLEIDGSSFNLNAGTLTVTAAGTTVLMGGGTINFNGGNASILNLTGDGKVNMTNGVVTILGTFNAAGAAQTIDGNTTSASPTLVLDHGATTSNLTDMIVGVTHRGTLAIQNGSTLNASDLQIGTASGGNGTVTVVGTNSRIVLTGSSSNGIGSAGGVGTLNILTGSIVSTTSATNVGFNGGTGTVNVTGGTWNVNGGNGGITIGDAGVGGTGIVQVNQGGNLNMGGSTLTLATGGTLAITGGTVTTTVIAAAGGRLTWSSGMLTVSGSGGLTLDNLTFGTGVSLGTPQALTVTGTLNVPATQTLTLTGGSVTAGSIAGPGLINLQTGSLQVTNSTLTIGSSSPLGPLVTIGPGTTVRVTNAAQTFTVAADGVLNITGGTVTAGLMTNAGEIDFGSPVAALGNAGQQLTNTGRVAGTGRVNANLINNANAVIFEDAGQRLVFAGATNTNNLNGTISLTGGIIEFTGTLTNSAGGFISGRGTFRGSSANTSGVGLINNGVVALSGGTSDIFGKVQMPFLSGTTPGTGQIINAGGGTPTFHDDVVHNGVEIRTVAGSRTVFFGAESGAGPFTGTGPVEMDGDLRPGNSPASVPYGGDLILGNSANLHAELGGTTLGSQYDHLQVAGNVSFAGNLDAQLINGFTPVLGQRFDIVTFGTRQGSFSSFTGLTLGSGLVFTAGFDASHFYLAVTPPATPGLSTWTGTTSGLWNDGSNWAPTGVPASSINTQLAFGVTPNAAMTNDIPGGLILNQLNFFSVAPVYSLAGNGLDFRTNGSSVLPQILLNSLNGVTISAPITLTNGLTVSGVGSLALNGAIGGAGSLFYAGTATLTLGNSANSFAGGTSLFTGTILTTAAGALPIGRPVSVIAGTLDLGGTSQSIGALNLSSIATTAASPRPIVQGGTAAGLTLGGDVTYSPKAGVSPSALTSSVLNLGGATRTINVTASGGDPYHVVITNHITGTGGLTTAGPGRVVLTSTSSYSGATTISGGPLFLAAVNALPATSPVVLSAGATLNASPAVGTAEVVPGNFNQTLGSVTGPATAAVTLLAGTLTLGSDNTNATFSGLLNIPGTALVKIGSGTQTLGGANSQTSTTINGGTLAVTADVALGPIASPITVNAFGTLTYAASATTVRAFTLNSGTMTVAANQTATLNGATIAGGFVAGPGTFALTGGAALGGVTTIPGSVINVTGVAAFVNVTNGGALTVAAGLATPLNLNGFTNQGSGSITVGAASQVNAAAFQTYGTLTLNPAVVGSGQFTELVSTGSSPLFFNGGSRTFIGTAATAGPPGNPNFVAGIDLNGKNAVDAGGLFVNNGFVADGGPAGTATIIADFGSLVKGAGFFQNPVVTQNGGRFQAGNSPGSAAFGKFVFGPGGVDNYVFAIDDAAGTAGPSPDALGHVIGWSLVNAVQRSSSFSLSSSGDFTWTATPSAKLTVAIDTLINPTTVGTDVAGPMADFDPTQSYVWPAVKWTGTYSGPTDAATLNADTAFDTSGFVNPIAGTFGWALSDSSLSLSYTPTPVPEPGTLALVGAAAAAGWWRRRRVAVS